MLKTETPGTKTPRGPNESTLKNIEALQKALDDRFPVIPIEEASFDGLAPEEAARLRARYEQNNAANSKLHEAFARYKEAACKPNKLFEYVQAHREEGFSARELELLTTYLTLRTNPTLGDLFFKDGILLRSNDIHTTWIRPNIGDEAGGGVLDPKAKLLDSHIELQYRSLQALKRLLKDAGADVDIPDDICTYAMIKQLLLFRQEGITIDDPLKARAWSSFEAHCKERGLILPHHVRKAWSEMRSTWRGDETSALDGTYIPTYVHDKHGKFLGDADEAFYAALRITKKLPNSAINYFLQTWKQQGLDVAPYDAATLLQHELGFLTREANADRGSHIEAYGDVVETYLGYLDQRKLSSKDRAAERRDATLYADIHVGENEGVEGSHADAARDLMLTLVNACANMNMYETQQPAAMLTNAFNHVVDHGYLHLQHAHIDEAVKEMTQAREEAIAAATGPDGGRFKDAFIKPRPAQAPRTWRDHLNPQKHLEDWGTRVGGDAMATAAYGF